MDYIQVIHPDSDEVEQFHNLLVEAFPDPYGREDVETLRANLREGNWASGDEICRYHLVVARREHQVVGGASFYFFSRGRIALGMGSYLAVKKEFRRSGIGAKLIAMRDQSLSRDAVELDCSLKGLIIQVSDPELMSAEEIELDSMNPREREIFWKQRGYRKLAFNFIQPPIRDGEPSMECLALYMFPYCPQWRNMEYMSRTDLSDVVYCFIRCTGTPGPPETDPSYLRMKSELASQEEFQLL